MNLKLSLLVRISLFAIAIFVVAVAFVLEQASNRVATHIERTGSTIAQLIADEVARNSDAYHRSIDSLDLTTLHAIGQLIHFCVEIEDLYSRPVADRCFAEPGEAPALLHWAMGKLIGSDVIYRGGIGYYPGIKVGELAVRPNIASEAVDAWRQISTLLWITLGILLLNFLVYIPVHRALRPTEQILQTLGRMEGGDLAVRLPTFELIELQRISSVFNHLADRLEKTISEQQKLAERLLTIREEERRHLARELHDELGQCLTSINAEAAYANELAQDDLPALLPCTQAIIRTTAHMMQALQQILRKLRPIGLDEFGLIAGLEQLIHGWNQRLRERCTYILEASGQFDDLPDNLTVSLYRIVQESLTNATRHGEATEVRVQLHRHHCIELRIEDDGRQNGGRGAKPGLGLLGMHERVQALGGSFQLSPRQPYGMIVAASIPLFLNEMG